MDISKTILSDPINRWVFRACSRSRTDIFLVGGYVRDLLQGRISKDKDFILSNNVEKIATETAKKFNGTFVALKPGQTYRVVLKQKETLDFTALRGEINNDLKERDFTVDSIAWSEKTGIIDPLGGKKDLERGIIKAVRAKNLDQDPLRTIRAYRIAADLGFKIEGKTRQNLRRFSGKLSKVASERITQELFRLLSNEDSTEYLKQCRKDKVLENIIPDPNMKLFSSFDPSFKKILTKEKNSVEEKKIISLLRKKISQDLNRLGLVRLVLLLTDGHRTYLRLKLSREISRSQRDIHNAIELSTDINSDDVLYKIFKTAGENVFETVIILSIVKKKNLKKLYQKADHFLKTKIKILFNGNDVQKILTIRPGVIVGEILADLHRQQFKCSVKTRAEARKWIISNFT